MLLSVTLLQTYEVLNVINNFECLYAKTLVFSSMNYTQYIL